MVVCVSILIVSLQQMGTWGLSCLFLAIEVMDSSSDVVWLEHFNCCSLVVLLGVGITSWIVCGSCTVLWPLMATRYCRRWSVVVSDHGLAVGLTDMSSCCLDSLLWWWYCVEAEFYWFVVVPLMVLWSRYIVAAMGLGDRYIFAVMVLWNRNMLKLVVLWNWNITGVMVLWNW